MKKITSLLCFSIVFLASFSVFSQFSFPADAGPYTVANGATVTINVNDAGNSGGVTAGLYDSFTVTADWVSINNAWASEADLTVTTTAGTVVIDPPTSGSATSGAMTTIGFSGDFSGPYDPSVDGALDIVMNQSYGGSSAEWSNIQVTLHLQPACPEPSNVVANAIATNSVELAWDLGGSEGLWDVEVVTAGTPPTGTPTETGVSNPHTVSGLTASTDYEFYVRADCGAVDGASEWVGPFAFTTACDVFTAPFVEPFDDSSTPNCWTEAGDESWIYSLGGDYDAGDAGDNTSGGGTNYAWIDGSGTANTVSTLTTPLVDVSPLIEPALLFSVFSENSNDGTYNTIDVEFYDGAAWNDVFSLQGASGGWQDVAIDLTTYNVTGAVQARFTINTNSTGDAFYNDILLDDVGFNEAPTCFKPIGLTATVLSANSVEFGWTAAGSEASWNIEVVPAGTPPTGTPTETGVSNPHTVNGLTAVTAYDFYVQADCGAVDGVSEWAGAVSVTTLCDVYVPDYLEDFTTIPADCWDEADAGDPTTGPQNLGGGSWTADGYLNNGTTGAFKINLYTTGKSDWILSPQIDLTGGPFQVEFDFAVLDWATTDTPGALDSDDQVQFLMSNDGGATWTALQTWDNTATFTATGTHYTFDLTANSGDIVQFGVWASEGATGGSVDVDVFFDNFRVREIPTCPEPSQLAVNATTPNSAELSWVQTGTVSAWNIEVVPAGTPATGTPTETGVSNPHTVNGLTAATDYEFYVQADCGAADGTSTWVGPFAFTTACDVFTAPFVEPFDDSSTPNCWTESGDEAWIYSTGADYDAADAGDNTVGGGTNYAWIDGSGTTNTVSTLTTPLIDVSPLTTPALFFSIFSENSSGGTYNTIEVEFFDGANWTSVYTLQGASGGWNDMIIDLSGYTITGPVQASFTITTNSPGSAFNNDILVDDVGFNEAPTCFKPINLTSTVLSYTSVEVSWTAGTETAWNIEYGPSGFVPGTGAGTVVNGVTNPYQISGLDANTNYDFYVQADCGAVDGVSEWAGTGSFFTGYCESVPTSNDGNGVGNVQIVTTDFPSFGDVTYEDHTATPVDAFAGILTNVQITFVTGTSYNAYIWIDLNDNFIFEPSELVYSGESAGQNPTTLNASFTMPATAPLGQHAMRIVTSDFGQSPPDPCYSGSWGVTLDFMLNIQQLSCTLPEATFTMIEDCDNGQVFVEVDVTSVGDATSLLISNNVDASLEQQITDVGTYQIGPFALDQSITMSLINEQNTDCTIISQSFLSSCPTYCLDALPICASDLVYPSIVGDQVAPDYLDYGCLGSQPDPQWNSIYFDQAGDYQFSLNQNTQPDGSGTGLDIDFIVWGPFNSQDGACFQLLPETQADCSFSWVAEETINLNGVQAGDVFIILITNYSQQNGYYTFTQDSGPTDGTNCSVVCDVVIEEVGGIDVTATDTVDFCGETSVTIEASSPYADEFDWYVNGFYQATTTTPTFEATTSGQYFVISRGDVCDGNYQSEMLTINLYDDTGFAVQPDDMTVCDADGFADFDLESQTAQILDGQSDTDFSVTYYATLVEAEAGDNSVALTSPYTNTDNPQTIYVRVEDIDAVNTGSDCYTIVQFSLVVTLEDDPSFTLNATCDGATATVTGTTGGTFAFSPEPGDDAVINAQTGEITGGTPGSSYTVVYTTAGNCPMSSTQTVTALPAEDASFTMTPTCDGATATVTGDAGGTFTTSDNIDVDPVTGEVTGGEYGAQYTVTYTTAGNCPTAATQTFTVLPFEDASFMMTPDVCGAIATVMGDEGGEFAFANAPTDSAVINSETGQITEGSVGTTYQVMYTTNGPCPQYDVVSVTVEVCAFPEVITPNGDAYNQAFDLSGYNVQSLEIFNRHGVKIFSKQNYTNEFEGISDDGEELPTGTYYYVVKYQGNQVKTAWLYINREK